MRIELYTKNDCSFCTKAKKLLVEKNLNYSENLIGVTVTREWVKEQFPEAKLVPIVVINGQYLGGYDELTAYLADYTTDRAVLAQLLDMRPVIVTFIKKDQTLRRMKCTRSRDLIPPEFQQNGSRIDDAGKVPKLGLMTVFDLEADDWRSFNLDTVVSVEYDLK